MRKTGKKQYVVWLALAVVLLVQTVMMVYFGTQKSGYHLDEMLTYELSNYPEMYFSRTEGFVGSWVDGQFFQDALTVDGLGDLDYSIAYRNQQKDVHPPLYYFIIHTVSALFDGRLSKWAGILPNMLCCLLATVLLYAAANRLMKNRALALITAAVWAWSVGGMSTAVFIRMYALLTCIIMALVLLHLEAFDNVRQGVLKKTTMAGLFLVTLMGILTQYYFLIICFFLCGSFFLYLCISRRWKLVLQYAVVEVAALCAAVVLFPTMLYHIFGGYRGEEAFSNMVEGGNFLTSIKTIGTTISRQVLNGWLKEGVLVLLLLLVAYLVRSRIAPPRRGRRDSQGEKKVPQGWTVTDGLVATVAVVALGYFAIVAKVAPYKTDRYFFGIYPLFALCLVYLTYRVLLLWVKKPQWCVLAVAVLSLGITVASYQMQTVNYIYAPYQQRQEALAPYEGYPVVTLTIYASGDYSADVFAMEFPMFSQVYRCKNGDYAGVKQAAQTRDIGDGFLLYVQDYKNMTHEAIREALEQQVKLDQFELLTEAGCRVYFCTLEEATP